MLLKILRKMCSVVVGHCNDIALKFSVKQDKLPKMNWLPKLHKRPYKIIAFDELKTDYKNPIDQCASLNPLVLPEYFIHIFFTVMFLLSGEKLSVMINIPLIAYHIRRYMNRPVMSAPGLYDPTSIMNADQLNRAQKEGWIKLAFYLISFFYYLYSMIYTLVTY